MPEPYMFVLMPQEGHVMAVTLWRCPECPLILVGPQIAGAEQHLETCAAGRSDLESLAAIPKSTEALP